MHCASSFIIGTGNNPKAGNQGISVFNWFIISKENKNQVLTMIFRFPCFLVFFILLSTANAEEPVLKNDPNRPVDKISKDLGITEDQFVECFNNVNPTPGGNRPESAERVHDNKSVLLPCLQKANPEITNDKLDEVMDRHRPGGRKAQEPMK